MLKRISALLASLLLSFSSLLVLAPVAVHAAADTCTWTGGGSDTKFSTAANWTGCDNGTVPESGDSLDFDFAVTNKAADNDLNGFTFGSITFSGGASQISYNITGNPITLTGGINFTVIGGPVYATVSIPMNISGNQTIATGTHDLTLSGLLAGSGNLTKTGTGSLSLTAANTGYTGAITVSAGTLAAFGADALGTATPGTTVSAGADLQITDCTSPLTMAENITLTGASSSTTGDFPTPKLKTGTGCTGGPGPDESYGYGVNTGTINLSGSITLGSDVTFNSTSATTNLTGTITGGFSFSVLAGSAAKLVIGNTTLTSPVFEKTLSDDQAAVTLGLYGNTVITLDGKRSDTFVSSGATLKGNGTVGDLDVQSGGKVAPGHSPGCITSTDLTLAGSLDEELGGTNTTCAATDGFDQLKVTGTVNLTGGTLNVTRFNDFKPKSGDSFTIIDNDTAADPVTGTFTNLAEGATFTVDGYVFKVSYVGGDGNDVVLTVQSVPATPDTGFQMLMNHPIITLFTTTLLALTIAGIARRYNKVASR